ncbi:MAG: RDD family protein [Sphingomonadales bacterium]|nr:RDD family protein [Sphingomonadales bacterium]
MSRAVPARSNPVRQLVTPEGIALPVTLASRGSRFGALMIDLTIITVTVIVVMVVLFYSLSGLYPTLMSTLGEEKQEIPGVAQFIIILVVLTLFLFRYGYFLFFELGARGATPGKRMTGIRIAARDGGRLSTEMVLARNLLRDIEILLPLTALISFQSDESPIKWPMTAWLLIFALFPFFNRDRLRAGDLIAGTWVLEAPRTKLEAAMSTGRAAVTGQSHTTGVSYKFSDDELAIYGEYELQTLERVLRENRHEAMVAVHEAICRKLGWNPGAGDEQAFLEAYYTQLRARLEAGMRMGKRKADKFAS